MTEQQATAPQQPTATRRVAAVAALVFGAILTLCLLGGAGAVVLVQNSRPQGFSAPGEAIDGFLSAIFNSHDPRLAGTFVCPRSRDTAELTALVDKVTAHERGYVAPRTTWTYPPVTPSGHQASAAVTLVLSAQGAQVEEKQLTVRLVEERGWWVCSVELGK